MSDNAALTRCFRVCMLNWVKAFFAKNQMKQKPESNTNVLNQTCGRKKKNGYGRSDPNVHNKIGR